MKTTINLPDALTREVKKISRQQGITMTRFIEEALRQYIAQQKQPRQQTKIQLTTFRGSGDESTDLTWKTIREHVYPQ